MQTGRDFAQRSTIRVVPTLLRMAYVSGIGVVGSAWLASSYIAKSGRPIPAPVRAPILPPWRVFVWLFDPAVDRAYVVIALLVSYLAGAFVVGLIVQIDYGAGGNFGYFDGVAAWITRFYERLPSRGGPRVSRVTTHDEILRDRASENRR